ncbi:MAG TPA: hypothetical protein EYH45_00765 [Candidatus Caldiarchaeum subterraneum]|uniref:ATP-citrate synthase/succinyl-CoA ligase C-terminal domain-containing protein n=1 Tax=Caldiarchaeum subterraneum TaxID=311458 RepID=A0A832ZVB9_CALS0|nr:hypothetical protein [Candidatus Caldarchaeum subterraneum]
MTPAIKGVIKKGLYRDSLQLMKLSEEAKNIPGVLNAAILMATEINMEILRQQGLLTPELDKASPDDLVVAVKAEDEEKAEEAIAKIEEMLLKTPTGTGLEDMEDVVYSIDSALQYMPDANLALISIPGEYVKDVGMELLRRGVHLHIFSDHVPLEDEAELKRFAYENGLLVLGPAAGTSIINGKAIAFANAVKRGEVGIVAAAGTGLQEVSVLLDRVGLGTSQGLGIGGNDVKEKVGGLMALTCIRVLQQDENTKVIVFISKPGDRRVMTKILKTVEHEVDKPFIACIQGTARYKIPPKLRRRIKIVKGLHAAASETLRAVKPKESKQMLKNITKTPAELLKTARSIYIKLTPRQKYVRALYTGGTLMYESLLIYKQLLGGVYSNAPLDEKHRLQDPHRSYKHTAIDLGAEEFTRGRPHPMIDPTVRGFRLVNEAKDPEVAVVVMDFMLGYGAHKDPAGAMLSPIREAKAIASADGRELVILAHVCGTRNDPQNLQEQENKLRNEGVYTFPSNSLAVITSALIASRGRVNRRKLQQVYREYVGG